jgi:hypothetical protein
VRKFHSKLDLLKSWRLQEGWQSQVLPITKAGSHGNSGDHGDHGDSGDLFYRSLFPISVISVYQWSDFGFRFRRSPLGHSTVAP